MVGLIAKSMLCIGGPYDGKRYEARGRFDDYFNAAVRVHPSTVALGPSAVDGIATVKSVQYRRDHFGTPQGPVSMWTPIDQTPLATMTKLLEGYEKLHSAFRDVKDLKAVMNSIESGIFRMTGNTSAEVGLLIEQIRNAKTILATLEQTQENEDGDEDQDNDRPPHGKP